MANIKKIRGFILSLLRVNALVWLELLCFGVSPPAEAF